MNFLQFLKAIWETLTLPKKPDYNNIGVPIDSKPDKNTGILVGEQQRPTDYIHLPGAVPAVPYEIRQPDGDWRPFQVRGEQQSFRPPAPALPFDTFNCTGYSNNNSAEVQLKQQTGVEYDFSDRALSVLAECTKQGNYLYKPADVGRNIGRILEQDYPDDGATSWEDYNKPLPAELMQKVFRFNEAYIWVPTDRASLKYHLKQAPLQCIVYNNTHAILLVYVDDNYYWYFDSYAPFLKRTTEAPSYALKIVVKPITQFVKQKGTNEFGFYAGGVNLADLKNTGQRLGYPIIRDDGSVPWDKAREISFS